MQCTQDLLDKFSLEHYTFINQIFGDGSVRDIIMKVCKKPHNKGLIFDVETVEGDELFERGHHHILAFKKPKGTAYCSVDSRHQLPLKNIHDTLCQTYSIMKYLNEPIDEIFDNSKINFRDKYTLIHKMMIDMYRQIIKNPKFIREMYQLDFKNTKDAEGKPMFRNYTKAKNPALNMDADKIIENIEKLLDKWESYGYWYFILDGNCEGVGTIPNLVARTEEIKLNLNKPSTQKRKASPMVTESPTQILETERRTRRRTTVEP